MKLNLPNLIIIGVHKSATTSLFMYLKAHPDVFGASKKEIHYFTPLRFGLSIKPIEYYSEYFKRYSNEKYALEASPSYFYGRDVIIQAMREVLPKSHKVILMLREPSSRFISFYGMLKSRLLLKETETISSFLEESLKYIRKPIEEMNLYSRAIQEGFYIDYLKPWIENYRDNIKIVYFENLKENPKSFTMDIANWLNIDPEFYENLNFSIEAKTVFAKNKLLHKTALLINQKFESHFRNHPNIKNRIRNIYYSLNESKQEESFDRSIMERLEKIYEEPNSKLKELLRKEALNYPSWL